TLRRMRHERHAKTRRRRMAAGVAAAVVAVALAGGGVALGRGTVTKLAQPTTTGTPSAVPGTRTMSGTDPGTGASMTVALDPAAGWVRFSANVKGIPSGQQCRVYLVSRDGTREEAGGWVTSKAGEANGTTLNGTAAIAPDNVK